MTDLLYVAASPLSELSFSRSVAEAFIDTYREANPDAAVRTLDLFEAEIPTFNEEAARAKYAILKGEDPTDQDREIWDKVENTIDTFTAADKYVFAVPMWNFSIPYVLKRYIDVIVQPGYTFSFDPDEGYSGLVTDRKAFIAYARGGNYSDDAAMRELDHQTTYMPQILGFMGITDVESVTVEPTLHEGQEVAEEKRDLAIDRARTIAENF